ncbi:MAG: hypothetical protein AAGF86_02095 [Pseudomonadota bacterium]
MLRGAFSIAALAALLAGCNADAVPSGEVNVKKFVSKLRGYLVPPGVVMTQGEQPVWIQAVTTGYSKSANTSEPAEVTMFEHDVESCTVPEPLQDEYLGHVFFSQAKQASSLYSYSDEDLNRSAKSYVKWHKRGKGQAKRYTKPVRSLNVIDVFVTETSKPVYLVLTSPSKAMWNVHPAEGVEIARIVLIGHETLGVATDRLTTPVEILRCNPALLRDPQPHWGFVRNVRKSGGRDDDLLAKNRALHRKFAFWYKQNFNAWASHNQVVANRANHALIGPVPTDLDARVPYKPIAERKIRITNNAHLVISDPSSFKSLYLSQVRQLAEEIAGGSLDSLGSQD